MIMRITSKTRYAITAMLDLALRGPKGRFALADNSEKQGASQTSEAIEVGANKSVAKPVHIRFTIRSLLFFYCLAMSCHDRFLLSVLGRRRILKQLARART